MTFAKFNDRGFLMCLVIGLIFIINAIALVIEARPGAGAIALLVGLAVIIAGQLLFPPDAKPSEQALRQAAGLIEYEAHQAYAGPSVSEMDLLMCDYASLNAHDRARVDAYEQFMIDRHTIA